MPLVELPAADPRWEAALALATPLAVDAQVEYVYLLRVSTPPPLVAPNAKIPLVPSAPSPAKNKPNPWADAAPFVAISGMVSPYANLVCEANTVNAALPVFTIV